MSPWLHTRASYSPEISTIILRLASTLSNAVLQQFGVFFSKWKRTLNFFGQRRDNNDSYNDPSFALDFDEEKRSLHFYEILHPLRQPPPPPSFCFSSSVFHSGVYQPGHTLAPCFLRARSVAAFCSAHRRGIPARQFIRKVFFAFSGLSPQTTHHRALVHTVFQALLPSSGARVHTCTREKRRPDAPRKRHPET